MFNSVKLLNCDKWYSSILTFFFWRVIIKESSYRNIGFEFIEDFKLYAYYGVIYIRNMSGKNTVYAKRFSTIDNC